MFNRDWSSDVCSSDLIFRRRLLECRDCVFADAAGHVTDITLRFFRRQRGRVGALRRGCRDQGCCRKCECFEVHVQSPWCQRDHHPYLPATGLCETEHLMGFAGLWPGGRLKGASPVRPTDMLPNGAVSYRETSSWIHRLPVRAQPSTRAEINVNVYLYVFRLR